MNAIDGVRWNEVSSLYQASSCTTLLPATPQKLGHPIPKPQERNYMYILLHPKFASQSHRSTPVSQFIAKLTLAYVPYQFSPAGAVCITTQQHTKRTVPAIVHERVLALELLVASTTSFSHDMWGSHRPKNATAMSWHVTTPNT